MPSERCPWYLSARAVSEFAKICGMGDPEDDGVFDLAEDTLVEVVRAAKFSRNQDNGLQLWAGAIPAEYRRPGRTAEHRLQLLVSLATRPEGNLPQLVTVQLRGFNARK